MSPSRTESVSRRMRAVRRENTSAELALQRTLRHLRPRFRTHAYVCGCRPDIVFPTARVAVFVDGDFWHGRTLVDTGARSLAQSFKLKSRRFWVAKIRGNAARDRLQTCRLRRHGWAVIRVWEKDLLRNPAATAALVVTRVSQR